MFPILDTSSGYLVESPLVNKGTNNVITAVNINAAIPPAGDTNTLTAKSIKWDKLAIEPNKITLTYDALGNLTNDGVRTYEWDANGMLKSVTSDKLQVKSEYEYDGLSRKVRSRDFRLITNNWELITDNYFVYDGWNCIAELTTQSSTNPVIQPSKSYVWGLDLSGSRTGAGGVGGLLSSIEHPVSSISRHFFIYDGNGNVVNLIDAATGATTAHYEYDPFGRLTCKEGSYADENPYRFSTKRYCAAWSLYDYGYRHYSPDLGRWLSRDPIRERGGLNIYHFVFNTPPIHVDYRGLWGDGNVASKGTGLGTRGHSDFEDNNGLFNYVIEDAGGDESWFAFFINWFSPNGGYTGPFSPYSMWRHFRDINESEPDLAQAVDSCNKDAFQRHAHQMQDYFSHRGYGDVAKQNMSTPEAAFGGHAVRSVAASILRAMGFGIARPDNSIDYEEAFKWAGKRTKMWVGLWKQCCCDNGDKKQGRSDEKCRAGVPQYNWGPLPSPTPEQGYWAPIGHSVVSAANDVFGTSDNDHPRNDITLELSVPDTYSEPRLDADAMIRDLYH